MFTLSKALWALLTPGNLFLLALATAVLLLWTRWRRAGRRLLVLLLIAGGMLSVVPLGRWLLVPLENRFPAVRTAPAQVDGVVVLGGSINQFISKARGQPALDGGAERLLAAARLARTHPTARLVFTGGSGDPFRQELKEAEVARMVWADLGLATELASGRVQFEDVSRNTHENAVLTYRSIAPRSGEVWLLVTSARHMPRAMGSFREAGWRPLAYPVDYVTDGTIGGPYGFSFAGGLGAFGEALKEWIGLLYYYVMGRTDALFPAP
ncbi:MAG: YdcF family protein [Alphaproteobacteria bacterium]|nr:YdcF family protein [Alphaproteobacteria bacterium]